MSVLVAVTDNAEGRAALRHAAQEAHRRGTALTAVNLTGSELDAPDVGPGSSYDVVVPDPGLDLDEVEQVVRVLEERPEVDLLVVGVRNRSALGKAILGSIAQRLILEAPVPVLAVKVAAA